MKQEGRDERLSQVEQERIIDHPFLPVGLVKAKKRTKKSTLAILSNN